MDFQKYLLLILVTTLLFSCLEENILKDGVDNAYLKLNQIEVIKLLTSEGNGAFMVADTKANFGKNAGDQKTYIRAGHNRKSIISKHPYISFTGLDLELDLSEEATTFRPDSKYLDFFGKELTMKFSTKSVNNLTKNPDTTMSVELGYIPEELTIQEDLIKVKYEENPNTGRIEITGGIESGDRLDWNADPDNPNGVYILIEYLPQLNKEAFVLNHPDPISDFVHIQDNVGQYVFNEYWSNSDQSFDGSIPEGAIVLLTIIRGNGGSITISTDDTDADLEPDFIYGIYSKVSGITQYNM